MIWLEMARDAAHGGLGWEFGTCLWAPTLKTDGTKWAFWENVSKVRQSDLVLHLRGRNRPQFVGFSEADTDGQKTESRPSILGQWEFAESFYRVDLRRFVPFENPIELRKIFSLRDLHLREYFEKNRSRPSSSKLHLFYVIQNSRLQCLNGAYLSEVDSELLDILLEANHTLDSAISRWDIADVKNTSQQLRQVKTRIGQQEFSQKVKANYHSRCCFPSCTVSDENFLVGSHIARWSDNPELRGKIDNGLCLCLMHDRAFELGLFTITSGHKVWVNRVKVSRSQWAETQLLPFNGASIQHGQIMPSEEALRFHWLRTESYPAD